MLDTDDIFTAQKALYYGHITQDEFCELLDAGGLGAAAIGEYLDAVRLAIRDKYALRRPAPTRQGDIDYDLVLAGSCSDPLRRQGSLFARSVRLVMEAVVITAIVLAALAYICFGGR